MSVFEMIRDAIFGKAAAAPAPAPTKPSAAPRSAEAQPKPAATQHVDVDATLAAAATMAGQPLNYKTSIVDLMKLLELNSSLDNRKKLAKELGYIGTRDGSADMNIWLHRAVMKKLAENGGKVSAQLQG